jgi:alpha-tubulin suppressor-like RCC1 family protein
LKLGTFSAVGYSINGRVFTWGYNDLKTLGDVNIQPTSQIIKEISPNIFLNSGDYISSISSGSYHVSVLTN